MSTKARMKAVGNNPLERYVEPDTTKAPSRNLQHTPETGTNPHQPARTQPDEPHTPEVDPITRTPSWRVPLSELAGEDVFDGIDEEEKDVYAGVSA